MIYPENKEKKITATDTNSLINSSLNSMKKSGKRIIDNAVRKKVNSLKSQLNKVPAIYKNLRNNLTLANNQGKKQMEEQIANTGNHTASGYAMSKRLNNQNSYNKELNNINANEVNEKARIQSEIDDAYTEGANEKLKLNMEYDSKNLD